MGIDPSCVNVTDLKITRPDRSGPGGDQVGAASVLGQDLDALFVPEDRLLRRAIGREVVSFGVFFIDPLRTSRGVVVPVVPGDLAEWTGLQGDVPGPQEIISVEPTADCEGALDVLSFRVGRSSAVGL